MAVAMPLPARGSEGFNFREQQGWIRTTQNKEARFCQKTWSRHNHVLAYGKKKKKRFQTNFAQSPTLMSIQIILKHKRCPDASPGSPTCPTRRKQLCKAQGYLNNLKTWKITFFQKPPNSKPRFSWNSITKTQHEANILFLLFFFLSSLKIHAFEYFYTDQVIHVLIICKSLHHWIFPPDLRRICEHCVSSWTCHQE